MNKNELANLYPGDIVKVTWGPKVYEGVVVTGKNYDDIPDPDTVVVYTGRHLMECIASQLTFIRHDSKIDALINGLDNIVSLAEHKTTLTEIKSMVNELWVYMNGLV